MTRARQICESCERKCIDGGSINGGVKPEVVQITRGRQICESCERKCISGGVKGMNGGVNGVINGGVYPLTPEEGILPPPIPRRQKLSILISLIYANFWMAASFSLQAPFFPQEAELKGATPTEYGFVIAIFELAMIIMCPIYGKLIPRITPKFLVTCGVFVGGISCCTFGLLDFVPAGDLYLTLAFIVRFIEGCGAGALMTASCTIVSSAFPTAVATSFSCIETAFGVGMIVGPTIGGALFEVGGFILPFMVNGSFLIVGCALLITLLPSVGDERQEGTRNLRKFLWDGGIIAYTLSIVSSLLIMGFNAATLEPHLRQFNLTPVVLGTIFVINGGTYALTTPLWGKLCDQGANPLVVCIAGYVMTCTGLLFLGPVPFIPFEPSLETVIGSLFMIGLGLAAKLISSYVGALRNTVDRGFPDNLATYAMVSAFISMNCSIGSFIGPSLGGFLLDEIDYRPGSVVIFCLEACLLVLIVLYFLYTLWRKKGLSEHTSDREPLLTASYARRSYLYSSL